MFKLPDLKHIFKKTRPIKEIQKDWIKQQGMIESFIDRLSEDDRHKMEWCTVQGRICQSTGLLMWEKDLDLKYTFANDRHCNDFYQISLANVRSLIGRTDPEISLDFKNRTGLEHTFGDLCKSTDLYTLNQGRQCRFWEMGYIGERIFILDVTKAPIKSVTGKITGTRSWALNQSAKECEVKTLLNVFLKTGEAVPLSVTKGKKVAAYVINKTDDLFDGKFPGVVYE